MAGGSGERLWPLSTPENPKQFVSLFGGKMLIQHAVDRLDGLVAAERIFVITAKSLVPMTRKALAQLPKANIIGEPCRRDTAAAVATACGLVKKAGGENAVGCILTADQLMTPAAEFRRTLREAMAAAASSDSIVTIGIAPTSPSSAFGYIECGERVASKGKAEVCAVRRFVEKPDAKTARRYLKSGKFLWNSGMFIWRQKTLADAFAKAASGYCGLIDAVAKAKSPAKAISSQYPELSPISFDYAVMEKISNILAVKGTFEWDDVGSWLAIANHFKPDEHGNTRLGNTLLKDVGNSIVVGDGDRLTAVFGLDDVVVIQTQRATLVSSKSQVQNLKELLRP
jgi:mannose-1-phosphate guanylyltransferase